MEIHWNYCAAQDGDCLLLVNGNVHRVKNFEEALDLAQKLCNEMDKQFE